MSASERLARDDVGVFIHDPDVYAWAATEHNACRGCSPLFSLHPIANFITNSMSGDRRLGFICDGCAAAIAEPVAFALLLRLRDVIPRSDFGFEIVSRLRFDEAANEWVPLTNHCTHCEEVFERRPSTGFGDYFLCQKVTRRPLCDTCARLLASTDLLDLLCSLLATRPNAPSG
jgi:hypothetical protein